MTGGSHPLDLVLDDTPQCREVSDLTLTRWPDCPVPPQHQERMGAVVAQRIGELQRQVAMGEGCCLAHALAQEMTFWFLLGYQAAQWEAAQAATLDVPDKLGEEGTK